MHNTPKERAEEELNELRLKLLGLQRFIIGKIFPTFGTRKQNMLTKQELIMREYVEVLQERLDNWDLK
jgi:hypothetical protein